MTVDASIEQIILQCAIGGVKDVALPMLRRTAADRFGTGFDDVCSLSDQFTGIRLRIDGQPRTGVIAWAAAACRVAGYVLSTDSRDNGSVEYAYVLRVRGLDIRRTTRIEDGRVSLLTDVCGSIADGKLNHVSLVLIATEDNDGTRITGVATGYSTIGQRCVLVRRIAERAIADALDRELLGRIQSGGIDLYRAGGITEALK